MYLCHILGDEELASKWPEWGSGAELIHLDFTKAFDLVYYRLLLAKPKRHGTIHDVQNKVVSFFRQQTFQVSVNGILSQMFWAVWEFAPIDRKCHHSLLNADDAKLIASRSHCIENEGEPDRTPLGTV